MILLMSILACDVHVFTGGGGHHSTEAGADAEAVLVQAWKPPLGISGTDVV